MFGGPFQAVSRVYGVRAWISIIHLDESRWHAGTVGLGPLSWLDYLVGLLEKVAALHSTTSLLYTY
jgi:hypothetical protein